MRTAKLPVAHGFLDWSQAVCNGADAKLFTADHPTDAQVAEALTYCRRCPIRVACEAAGQNAPGIWGGQTEVQRSQARTDAVNAQRRIRKAQAA